MFSAKCARPAHASEQAAFHLPVGLETQENEHFLQKGNRAVPHRLRVHAGYAPYLPAAAGLACAARISRIGRCLERASDGF